MAKSNNVTGSPTKALNRQSKVGHHGLPSPNTFPRIDEDSTLESEGEVRLQVANTQGNGGFYRLPFRPRLLALLSPLIQNQRPVTPLQV